MVLLCTCPATNGVEHLCRDLSVTHKLLVRCLSNPFPIFHLDCSLLSYKIHWVSTDAMNRAARWLFIDPFPFRKKRALCQVHLTSCPGLLRFLGFDIFSDRELQNFVNGDTTTKSRMLQTLVVSDCYTRAMRIRKARYSVASLGVRFGRRPVSIIGVIAAAAGAAAAGQHCRGRREMCQQIYLVTVLWSEGRRGSHWAKAGHRHSRSPPGRLGRMFLAHAGSWWKSVPWWLQPDISRLLAAAPDRHLQTPQRGLCPPHTGAPLLPFLHHTADHGAHGSPEDHTAAARKILDLPRARD